MLVFSTGFVNYCPSNLLSGSEMGSILRLLAFKKNTAGFFWLILYVRLNTLLVSFKYILLLLAYLETIYVTQTTLNKQPE
jgi:hypothetical protein